MLVFKRILSVILSVFATVLLIAPVQPLLKAFGCFLAGKTEEALSSAIAGFFLLAVCLLIFKVARALWKDRSVPVQGAFPPAMIPVAGPFDGAAPPMPPSALPVTSQPIHSFAPFDN